MKQYCIRAAKYALQLVIIFFAIFFLMNLFSSQKLSLEQFFSHRGALMGVAILAFSLLYPFFGYTKKRLTFSAADKVAEVEKIMTMCGFIRTSGDARNMEFRAATQSKRWMLMFEDRIVVRTDMDGVSEIEGIRKEVVKAYFRMGTYIG